MTPLNANNMLISIMSCQPMQLALNLHFKYHNYFNDYVVAMTTIIFSWKIGMVTFILTLFMKSLYILAS